MGMYAALGISATGLTAQRLRMDVVANNLANADSTFGPGQAYRRKEIVMTTAPGGPSFSLPGPIDSTPSDAADLRGVQVAGIVEDTRHPMRRVYDPGNPQADAQGYVTKPNVNAVTEMVDLVAATRSYQANVTTFDATKQMALETLKVLR
jgi:flagellar basal-body rod protein FlgC